MKVYLVGLVGESNYQQSILRTHPGEVARICHEPDNPYDANALRVENNVGDVIGYIGRSHWLHRALHEEGRGVAATIREVTGQGREQRGIVLNVTLTDDILPVRSYAQTPPKLGRAQGSKSSITPSRAGPLGQLIKGILSGFK